jgi:hypothetical protein
MLADLRNASRQDAREIGAAASLRSERERWSGASPNLTARSVGVWLVLPARRCRHYLQRYLIGSPELGDQRLLSLDHRLELNGS